MANERTEEATPKRRSQTRSEGKVSKSQELSQAVTLLLGFSILFTYFPYIFSRFKYVATSLLKDLNHELITRENILGFIFVYLNEVLIILLPIMAVMFIAGFIVNFAQVGPLLSFKAIKPDFSKLTPAKILSNFKKFVELKSLIELLKSFAKLLIIGGTGSYIIDKHKLTVIALLGADPETGLVVFGKVVFELVIVICIILLILGIIDKKYQDYEYEKSIKMTKEEVKDERKNAQGDPKIKGHIRKMQTRFASQRMMSAVPSADVVVANPTHYSIALRYDTSKAPAPQVIAKGADYVAFKIREIAEANNIPVVENPPLARTLYKIVPLDGLIPAELYVAVAEVLAFVYRTNKGNKN